MSFDTAKAPKLRDQDLPTSTSKGHTLYLEIDLEVPPGKGQPVEPLTAVFAPDPSLLPSSNVDVILWLHGDKKVWSRKRGSKNLEMWGTTIQDYLKTDECKLREFITAASKKGQFVLIAPTLADHTSAEGYDKAARKKIEAGGLLGDPDTAKAYIDVCLKAVNEYMKKSVKSPRNIVLAAHSGGGHILGNMAGFNGIFTKQVEEIWCFDCTYWGNVVDWASKSHATRKLFVYSTGEGPDTDRPNPKFDSTQPEGPKNQKYLPSGTGYTASDIMQLRKSSATTIEVLIEAYNGNLVNEQMTPHFKETYGIPDGKRHYESIEKYLGKLVDMSDNLQ